MEEEQSKARSNRIQVYLSDDELERIEWAAKEVGATRATFLRMGGLRDAKAVLG